MKTLTNAFLIALVVLGAGCHWAGIRGNGEITTEQRNIEAISEIEAGGAFRIEWHSGPPSLSITTDQNLLSHIGTRVIDKKLRLRSDHNLWPTHGINVVVSSPNRVAAKLTGATRLTASQLTGAEFAVETTGAAKITLDGTVDRLVADMTGASQLKAASLKTKTAELSTTGAADAEVTVSDALRVSITGAGKVTYAGNPPTLEKHVTGAGSIRHRE